jgi:hypothetical protein
MRVAEWVPWSAAALITGAMALVLSEFISPIDGDDMAALLAVARENDGRWTAMSVLWSVSAAGFVLGCPCIVMALQRRGRKLGYAGVTLFATGAVGLAGFAALSLVFRALALSGADPDLVTEVLDDPSLLVVETIWVVGLVLGLAVIAVALLVGRTLPIWIPLVLLAFVAIQLLSDGIPLLQRIGYIALGVGFTGVAVEVAAPSIGRRAAHAEV